MIVYLITAGQYSDYSVYSVALDKQDAQDQANRLQAIINDSVGIEQRDTDLMRNLLNEKIHAYRVTICVDSCEVQDIKQFACRQYPNFFETFTRNGRYYVTAVFEQDEQHAKRAALDRFYKAKAWRQGI